MFSAGRTYLQEIFSASTVGTEPARNEKLRKPKPDPAIKLEVKDKEYRTDQCCGSGS
jgi:hypothetical protein